MTAVDSSSSDLLADTLEGSESELLPEEQAMLDRRRAAEEPVMELHDSHRRFLASSAIADEVACARGYRSITDARELRELGFSKSQARVPALLVPVWAAVGDAPVLHQSRPDSPRSSGGKPILYETAAGVVTCIDVPRSTRAQLGDPDLPLWITQGARNADAAASAGVCCIALAGAWRSRDELLELPDWERIPLDRAVLLAFDSDALEQPSTRDAVQRLRAFLMSRGARVRVAHLPGDGDRTGLADYIAAGGKLDALEAEATPELEPPGQPGDGDAKSQKERTAAAQLVAFADDAELFHTPGDEAYATVRVNEHRETFALTSRLAEAWLRRCWFQAYGKGAPSSAAVRDALATLAARAVFDGEECEVYTRVAGHQGAIYIDLGDTSWRAIEIARSGWRLIDDPPVKFRRSPHALALPEPRTDGSLEELRTLLNMHDDAGWALIAGFLVGALSPRGPYPILVLHGEQGSAKSSTTLTLRNLIDPSRAPLRALPRNERDLVISAAASWCPAFDNVSHLEQWLSDALARISTGAGFATRRLHSDDEEMVFEVARPVILNGIAEFATRSDLLSRTVLVELPVIPPTARLTERAYWAAFDRVRPSILGGLLDALCVALLRLDQVQLEHHPRMADFAEFVTAAEPGLGLSDGAFMRAYDESLAAGDRVALESEPVTVPLLELLNDGLFEGTASDLLDALDSRCSDERAKKHPRWPKNAQALAGRLTRLSPNLRAIGVEIDHFPSGRDKDKRKHWRLSRADPQLWGSSDPEPEPELAP